MVDALAYTYDEAEKQMNLLEVHLKQSNVDPGFCIDCVRKHLNTIEGLAEEGIGFGESESEKEKFERLAKFARETKKQSDIKENGPEYAEEVRKHRKMLIYGSKPCTSCQRKPKNLNITSDYDDSDSYSNTDFEVRQMAGKKDLMEVGVINGSQLIGYGGMYLGTYLDTRRTTVPAGDPWMKRPSTWVGLGGGVGLQLLGVFLIKKDVPRTALVVAGSYMLVTTIANIVKESTALGAGMRGMGSRRMMSPVRMSVGGALPQQGLVRVD